MAEETTCGKLLSGLDLSCEKPVAVYYQKAVLMNVSDRDGFNPDEDVEKDCDGQTPKYNVDFTLKEGKKGFAFIGPTNGTQIRGIVSKSTDDNGFVQYQHQVQILFGGTDEKKKCILEGIDKGKVFAALRTGTDDIEIYGMHNGMSTDDYDLDIVDEGGAVLITLTSNEDVQEPNLPYIYDSNDALADFEALFENEEA